MTRSVFGPDALPPQSHPISPLHPPLPTGRGSLSTCGDVEPNPGPPAAWVPGPMVLPLDTALSAPGIRGHFTLRANPPGQTLWWCVRCGMSWRAAQAASTCPDGCAPWTGTPLRGHQSWLRQRQLIIGKRSPEYQALRSAGLSGESTTTPRIDHPCPGRDWGRRYHAWRHNLHRWAIVCPVPQTVAVPAGPARVPPGGHGPDASPQLADLGFPVGLPERGTGKHAPATPADPHPNVGPPGIRGAPGRGPGSTTHGGTPPHRHAAPRESAREDVTQAGRATLPPSGNPVNAPITRSVTKPRPS